MRIWIWKRKRSVKRCFALRGGGSRGGDAPDASLGERYGSEKGSEDTRHGEEAVLEPQERALFGGRDRARGLRRQARGQDVRGACPTRARQAAMCVSRIDSYLGLSSFHSLDNLVTIESSNVARARSVRLSIEHLTESSRRTETRVSNHSVSNTQIETIAKNRSRQC